jgi:chromosomal replication initiator protein
MDDFWSHCLAHFERSLNAQQLNTWIKPLVVEGATGSIVVNAPEPVCAQWVRDKFLPQIDLLARSFFPEAPSVSLAISDQRFTFDSLVPGKRQRPGPRRRPAGGPESGRPATTRCSSMAASAWARPT